MIGIYGKYVRILLLALAAFLPVQAMAQILEVTGRVQDTNGEPLIGATVCEKGKEANGTVTDINGTYNFKIQKGKTIQVSYI